MSRRRLPAAGLGGMFSLAARVPIFSGYYTTPAMEGKGRADCASAARGPPLGSREERGYPGISALPFFSGTPLGRRRFLGALSWVSGAVDWRRAFFRCAALVFFWADAHEGKGRAFLKKGAPKTFTLAALGLFTASAAPRRFPPLPARRPGRAGSSCTGWGFAASPPHTAGPAAAAGPSSSSWPGRPGYSWWPWGR